MPIAEANVDTFSAGLSTLFDPWGSPKTTKTKSPDQTWDVCSRKVVPAPSSAGVEGNALVLHMPPPLTSWHPSARGVSKDSDGLGYRASVALPAGCDPGLVRARAEAASDYNLNRRARS